MRAQPVLSDEKKLFLGHAGRQANAARCGQAARDARNITVTRTAMQKPAVNTLPHRSWIGMPQIDCSVK